MTFPGRFQQAKIKVEPLHCPAFDPDVCFRILKETESGFGFVFGSVMFPTMYFPFPLYPGFVEGLL